MDTRGQCLLALVNNWIVQDIFFNVYINPYSHMGQPVVLLRICIKLTCTNVRF